jgi:phospholipid transport system substrate-binding protein
MIARRELLSAGLCTPFLASRVFDARAAESPVATITELHEALVETARRLRSAAVAERYRALEPAIVATHDLPYIAEFALRRQWPTLTMEERQRFVAAFQRLSVMTYAARFGNVAADAFRPLGTSALGTSAPDANGRVEVTTAIAREGQPDVSLEYLLQRDGEDWRIVNIVADGVSDLALKRAEYQRLFASGGIEGLIAELEQQTDRLEGG